MAPVDTDLRLIDLGTLPSRGTTGPPPRPTRRWSAARAPVPVAAALVVLVLLAVAGSAPDTPLPGLREVPLPVGLASVDLPAQNQTVQLRDGLLTLFDAAVGRSHVVTLEPAAREWADVPTGWVFDAGGGLVEHVRQRCTDGDVVMDILDRRDGHPRARVKGQPLGTAGGLLAVLGRRADRCVPQPDGQALGDGPAKQVMRVYDLATGALRWASAAPVGPVWPVVAGRGGQPVVYGVGADGRWLVLDLATGAPLPPSGARDAPAVPDRADGTTVLRTLLVTGTSVLLVSQRGRPVTGGLVAIGGPAVVTAFDPGSLRRRWSRTVDADPPTWLRPVDCRPLVCLNDDTGAVGLDASGAERWRAPGVRIARPVGTHWALTVSDRTADYTGVVDTRTGETVVSFTLWRVALPLYLTDAVPARLILYLWDADRTLFGALDLDRGAVQPLPFGWVPGHAGGCAADGRYVACRTPSGHAGVWRLAG